MRYVICYDIADDRRRQRLAAALLDFAPRAQESAFVADLEDELYSSMMARVSKLIDTDRDVFHVFPQCECCAAKCVSLGRTEIPVDKPFYVL